MIIHVLKDGSRPESVKDKVVKIQDAEVIYKLLSTINNDKRVEDGKNK